VSLEPPWVGFVATQPDDLIVRTPAARVLSVRYEDEDGRVTVVVPPTCSEQQEDRIELGLAARAGEIFEATGLFIVCGVLDRSA
jgi:hypothetical protein